jgi:hypothetical protein
MILRRRWRSLGKTRRRRKQLWETPTNLSAKVDTSSLVELQRMSHVLRQIPEAGLKLFYFTLVHLWSRSV